MNLKKKPKIFISYSWDSKIHIEWVRKLVRELYANGLKPDFDQFALYGGIDKNEFMLSLVKADRVILILTPNYKEKAEANKGSGVKTEYSIIQNEIMKNPGSKKFIPILREGDVNTSCPTFIEPRIYEDFTDDKNFNNSSKRLIRILYGLPAEKEFEIGEIPNEITSEIDEKSFLSLSEIEKKTYIINYNSIDDNFIELWPLSANKGIKSNDFNSLTHIIDNEYSFEISKNIDEKKYLELSKYYKDQGAKGNNYCLTKIDNFDVDGENSSTLKLQLTKVHYHNFLAIRKIMQDDRSLFFKTLNKVNLNPREYVNYQPLPVHINTNTIVINQTGDKVLVTKRSTLVDTAKNMWVCSINETMRASGLKHEADKSVFHTMKRGLLEELGLNEEHYEPILLSWIGLAPPRFGGHFIGITKLKIPEVHLEYLKTQAMDDYEHSNIDWLDLRYDDIFKFFKTKNKSEDDAFDVTISSQQWKDKLWLHHFAVNIREIIRMEKQLNLNIS